MLDPRDRDIVARTVVGEAAGQPFAGQQAVANVILNRLRSGKFGGSISDVVFAPYQFEPWQTRRGELMAIPSDSPAYMQATQAIDAALQNDPTGGATHFLNPQIVMRRTGKLPTWAQGPGLPIGQHTFFNPGSGGPSAPAPVVAPTTGAPQAAPAAMPFDIPSKVQAEPDNIADLLALSLPTGTALTSPGTTGQAPRRTALPEEPDAADPLFDPRTFARGRVRRR